MGARLRKAARRHPDGVVNEERLDFIKRTMTFKRNWRAVIADGDETATENYYLGMDAYLKGFGTDMRFWNDENKYLYITLPSGENEYLLYEIKCDTMTTLFAAPPPGGTRSYKYVKVK